MSEQRLVELETKLAYQEIAIDELNDVICRQQERIDQLEARIERLRARTEEPSTLAVSGSAEDEKPPHY